MLVLTRRPGRGDQSVILIGEGITVEVINAQNGAVRLGITAPEEIRITNGTESTTRDDKRRSKALR